MSTPNSHVETQPQFGSFRRRGLWEDGALVDRISALIRKAAASFLDPPHCEDTGRKWQNMEVGSHQAPNLSIP